MRSRRRDSRLRLIHSREPDLVKMRGGVGVPAREGASREEVQDTPRLPLPLNSCTVLVNLHDREIGVLKLRGCIYHPKEEPRRPDWRSSRVTHYARETDGGE